MEAEREGQQPLRKATLPSDVRKLAKKKNPNT
jgi:hypothetical protein